MCVFLFPLLWALPQQLDHMQDLIRSTYSWKAYGIRLNWPGLCNIGKIFHHLPWPAFILGFAALFTLGLVCPHLCTFRTCGNTTCGAFVFPPDKVMHCMILGWKTQMMGLMLAFQFTMPFTIIQGQNFLVFHTIWPNTYLPSNKINYRISCPITIHCRTPHKGSQTCWPC